MCSKLLTNLAAPEPIDSIIGGEGGRNAEASQAYTKVIRKDLLVFFSSFLHILFLSSWDTAHIHG